MANNNDISKATIARLPAYLRYLNEKILDNEKMISSSTIAEDLRLNAVQVRKDLALVSSVFGRPRTGFEIRELTQDIRKFLGYDKPTEAVLVGVGGLGKALLSYNGFANYGLNIVAAFDNNPVLVGLEIDTVANPIMSVAQLPEWVAARNINIGIITVPREAAQTVADIMVSAGIRAIWNFAPAYLKLESGVAVKNEDMAASLAILREDLSRL